MKSALNKFVKGLVQDVSDVNQGNDSYNDSMGATLMYNDNGNFDWVVASGNKFSVKIVPNFGADTTKYIPIGAVGNTDVKVMFSVNDSNLADIRSEIGLFSSDPDGNGTYITLFNDQFAPNADRLQFHRTNQIQARFLYENDNTIRVYWVDGIESDSNPPRVFTFKYDSTLGGKGVATSYVPVTTSLHSINVQAEFTPGLTKYKQTINGGLLSGVYQYVYRLITEDGYATPWTIPTRRLFVTSDNVNATDWNKYEMEPSGLPTTKGNRIEIKGIDVRYKDIQVAYIYCKTDLTVDETSIFTKTPILNQTTMVFDHVSMTGEPIVSELLATQFAGIKAAKTLDAKDSTLYYGNIIEGLALLTDAEKDAIVANVSIEPIFRHMRSDELDNDQQTSPLTHQTPKNGTASKALHNGAGGVEVYDILGDYVNYKGTQIEKEFSAFWRGETYRLAIQLVDKVGLPIFAIHLGDFKTPEQTTKAYSWQRLRADGNTIDTGSGVLTGDYPWLTDNYGSISGTDLWNEDGTDPEQNVSKIRIMGLEISGINLSGVISKVGGYSIVRADRDPTILAQGLALPCISDTDGGGSGADQLTRPLHTVTQRWIDSENLGPNPPNLYPGMPPADVKHLNYITGWSQPKDRDDKYGLRANITTFHAPDFDFDQQFIPSINTGDRMKIVSSSFGSVNDNPPVTLFGDPQDRAFFSYYNWRTGNDMDDGGQHTLTKQYYSKNQFHFSGSHSDPYPSYQASALLVKEVYMARGEKRVYNAGIPLYFDNNTDFQIYDESAPDNPEGYSVGFDEAFYQGKEKTIMNYTHQNYDPPSSGTFCWCPLFLQTEIPNAYHHGGLLCNYYRPNNAPYGGVTSTSMEQTIFFSTGHFQPLNNPQFPMPSGSIFNGVEVWGGDCYVDYFAFLRTYPRYWGSGRGDGTGTSLETDVAHGIVMPYESTLNYAMRQAPSVNDPMYPIVAARPEDTQDGTNSGGPWGNGLWDYVGTGSLIEEFDINGALLQRELLKFFSTEPQDFDLVDKFPVRWRYTGNKIYGDVIDYWRQFLAFDYNDLNGIYGQITSSSYYMNQIYSFQESAYGRLRASDRAVLTTTIGGLTTGTGAKLDGVDYISTKYGNQHQNSLINSGKSLYWMDVDKRKMMRFAGDGKVALSDVRGLHTFLKKELGNFYNQDNPAGTTGICGVFDYENNNLMFTFVRDYHRTVNANIIVDSSTPNNPDYYENNSTIFVKGFSGSVIFPETVFGSSINNSVVYYVANELGANPVNILTSTTLGPPVNIAVAVAGTYWEVKRGGAGDAWVATQVALDDITPFKATIQYNEDLNEFTGFFPFQPTFYFDHKNQYFTHDKDLIGLDNNYYVHNLNVLKANYYGQDYKSYIAVNVNQDDYATKVFDSIRVNFNEQGAVDYSRFLFNTEGQYNYYDVQSDTRLKYLEDSMRMPVRTFNQTNRSRGKWVNFIFEFKNNGNIPVKLYNLMTNYRVSNRM